MRNRTLLNVLLVLVFSLFCFVGCNVDEPKDEVSIALSRSAIEIEKYGQTELSATVENSDDNVRWVSNNTEVATVENGIVTALSEGTAVVTANVGDVSAQCIVTVVSTDQVPWLTLDKEQVEVMIDGSLTVSAKVVFDGVDYESEYSFTITDPSVATVNENGVVKGLTAGESTVLTVSCVWRGATLTESIEVKVKEILTLSWLNYDGSTIELSTTDIFGGKTTHTATPYIKEADETITAPTVVYSVTDKDGNASTLVSVNANGEIASTGKEGVAYVQYAYVSTRGKTYTSASLQIECVAPVVDIAPLDLELGVDSNNKQNTTLTLTGTTFGLDESVTITSVTDITDGEKTLAIENGVVSGVDVGVYTWLIGNSDGYYQKAKVTLATLIISNATELAKMTDILNASVVDNETYSDGTRTYKQYHGYFIMDNDVDYDNKAFVAPEGIRGYNINNGFVGTFDGRGYTISNIKFERVNGADNMHLKTGLFGALGANGVLKNVNFTGVNLSNTWAAVVGIASFGRVENVNIEVTSMAAGASGISMYGYTLWKDSVGVSHHGGAQLENVVIELNIASAVTLAADGGTFFCMIGGDVADCQGQFINNYYITNGKLTLTNTWNSNTSTVGTKIVERFDAAGNSNHLITGSATSLTATTYVKESGACNVNLGGSTVTEAIVLLDGVRIDASISNGALVLPTSMLDTLATGSYTVTVLSGEKYLECTLTVS